jgi:hypothetical protein
MGATEPPLVGERQAGRTDRTLAVLADHHCARTGDRRAYGGHCVEDEWARAVARLAHPRAAEPARNAQRNQILEAAFASEAGADQNHPISAVTVSRELRLGKGIEPVAEWNNMGDWRLGQPEMFLAVRHRASAGDEIEAPLVTGEEPSGIRESRLIIWARETRTFVYRNFNL